MADDLVKKLRQYGQWLREDRDPSLFNLITDEAADRIEHLQKLLEMRDVFIVKHGLWHEFVDSLELKND